MHNRLQSIGAALLVSLCTSMQVVAQEREWQLDAQDEDAYLVFGVPSTADIGISFWCKIGEKTVNVFAPVPETVKSVGAKVSILIADHEYHLKPKFNTDQNTATLEAELKPSAEILTAMTSAERISLKIADHNSVFPTEGANFTEFNKLCTTSPVSN